MTMQDDRVKQGFPFVYNVCRNSSMNTLQVRVLSGFTYESPYVSNMLMHVVAMN